MSTRSRRSAGGDGATTLNPAMIQLFDTARLKKELETRGLSIVGQKHVLADRLYDAVVGNTPLETVTPSPKPKQTRRKSATVKVETEEESDVVTVSEAKEEEEHPIEQEEPAAQKKTVPKRIRKVKEEPADPDYQPDESQVLSPKRKRVKREPVSPQEPEASTSTTVISRKKVKSEVEEVTEDNTPIPASISEVQVQKKSPEKKKKEPEAIAPSPKKIRRSAASITESIDDSPPLLTHFDNLSQIEPDEDDDTPLLSLLTPATKKPTTPLKVVRKEPKPEPVEEGSSELPTLEQPCHQHGTRRSTAMKQSQMDVLQNKERMDLIQNSKLLSSADCESSPEPDTRARSGSTSEDLKCAAKPSQSVRNKDDGRRKSLSGVTARSTKPGGTKFEVEKLKSAPRPPPEPKKKLGNLWAEKVAELKRKSEAKTNEGTSEAVKIPKPKIEIPKGKAPVASKPQVQQAASTGGFVLDEILSKQEELTMEAKRKKEADEAQQREAERRVREKLAAERKKAAEAALLASSSSSSSVNSPTASSTPKAHPYSIPKPITSTPHPYSVPQPLSRTNSPAAVAGARVPPPPPKKTTSISTSGGNSAVNSPASVGSPGIAPGSKLAPPPPPPKLVPPPPPKAKKDVSALQLVDSLPSRPQTKYASQKTMGEDQSPDSAPRIRGDESPAQASVLIDSVTRALLSAMKNPDGADGEACNAAGPSGSTVTVKGEEFEEYDPLENSIVDVSEYVPSAIGNLTMEGDVLEDEMEEDEYVPSDYEAPDDGESDSDGEGGVSKDGLKENVASGDEKPRASAGKDDKRRGKDPNKITVENLLKNPRDLLMKASAVLESLNKNEPADPEGPQYVQMPCGDDYEHEEQEKKTPEYHGEPVPSDDDDFFELAAGISKPKKKKEVVIEEEKLPSDETIEPDYYNADLHIKGALNKNWQIEPENADGLALMWGGVRSNYGIRLPFRDVRNCDESGNSDIEQKPCVASTKKIAFQVKITEFLPTKHLPFEEMDPHDIRVGFSLRSASNILGETPNSYCITSLGKKATDNYFTDFGAAFHLNDVVTACIDLEKGEISFWKNDEFLGVAFSDINLPDEETLYPHICIKNCNVAVNFGDFPGEDDETKWPRNDEWRFFSTLGRGDLERSPKSPESKAHCTVIMMVGLPGVGKTSWVREYLREHPHEQWTVINCEGVMSAMKVNGVSRKRAHQGRWDMVMGLIGKSLQRSVLLAARRRRNYILDMTNTSRDTRKKRLQLFEEFRRKCVILMPSDEDMLDRQARQARLEGTAIMPPEAMLEMKAVISLPSQELEPIEDVYFIEPPVNRIQEAIDQVNRYNEEARPWFQKKYRRRRSQMIGLGDGVPRDNNQLRKFIQPLTVLPQLKVAVIPLDDPSNVGPLSTSSLPDSGPHSASLGFTVVQNSSPSTSVQPHIDLSIPPPTVSSPGIKPLVRVTIEDIPSIATPLPFKQPNGSAGQPVPSLDEEMMELDEEELKELRESKANAQNPMIAEAVMRAKLKALLCKKKEKREAATKAAEKLTADPARVSTPVPASGTATATSVTAGTSVPQASPIQVIGGRNIPTIGAVNPITIDTEPAMQRRSSVSGPNSPRLPQLSPAVSRQFAPSQLAAPYLASPVVSTPSFNQFPPISPMVPVAPAFPGFNVPPPSVGFSMPPPGIIMPATNATTSYASPGFQQWSQPNGGN